MLSPKADRQPIGSTLHALRVSQDRFVTSTRARSGLKPLVDPQQGPHHLVYSPRCRGHGSWGIAMPSSTAVRLAKQRLVIIPFKASWLRESDAAFCGTIWGYRQAFLACRAMEMRPHGECLECFRWVRCGSQRKTQLPCLARGRNEASKLAKELPRRRRPAQAMPQATATRSWRPTIGVKALINHSFTASISSILTSLDTQTSVSPSNVSYLVCFTS